MNLTNHISSLMATARMHGAGARMQNVNEARFGLASQVGANSGSGDVPSLATQDKALTLQGAQAQTNYLVAQAMLEGAQERKQKDQEFRQRLMAAGSLYP